MRLREVHSSLILSSSNQHAKNHELIIVELLLDIRDQNEEIKLTNPIEHKNREW